jgi:O-antigen/teichoic acid export membrane protein
MNAVIKRVQTKFKRDETHLLSGSLLAQLIPILVSPILTRIYTAESFGMFGQMTAYLSIATIIATGKYENAFFYPEAKSKAREILYSVISFSILTSVFLSAAFFIILKKQFSYIELTCLSVTLIFTCISSSILTNYFLLDRRIKHINLFKQHRAILIAILSISLGALSLNKGLIISYAVGVLLSTVYCLYEIKEEAISIFKEFKIKNVKEFLLDFIDNPKYQLPINLLFNISMQGPLLVLGMKYDSMFLGYYTLANRLVQSPANLITNSIGDIFKLKLMEISSDKDKLLSFYRKKLIMLFSVGVIPFITSLFIVDPLIELLFGRSWEVTSEIIKFLLILFFFKYLSSPFSVIFIICKKQKANLYWQIMLFFLVCTALGIGLFYDDFMLSIRLYAVSFSIAYIVYLYQTYLIILNLKSDA